MSCVFPRPCRPSEAAATHGTERRVLENRSGTTGVVTEHLAAKGTGRSDSGLHAGHTVAASRLNRRADD